MEVIILCGGQGTRLRSIVPDLPKPMAPVGNVPFLRLLIEDLVSKGVKRIILATGYKSEIINNYFGHHFNDCKIDYSKEDHPLGTGGALRLASSMVEEDFVMVQNGDSYIENNFYLSESPNSTSLRNSIVVREIDDSSRYGCLSVDLDGRIINFCEKSQSEKSSKLINAGIYFLSSSVLNDLYLFPEAFSLEEDFFPCEIQKHDFYALNLSGDAKFIDIGIPSDYIRAQSYLKSLTS